MGQAKPKSLLISEISKDFVTGRTALIHGEEKAALHLLVQGFSKMVELHNSVDEPTFIELNAMHGWASKLLASLLQTLTPKDAKESGAYCESAIESQLSILEQMLVWFHQDKELTSQIHIAMAYLLYDPEQLDAFDFHYSMAVTATPDIGRAYLDWSQVFGSQSSSKKRQHAIEILEQGANQPSLREGDDIRIRILEALIHRCTKEKRQAEADIYTKRLHELRPIRPVASNLKIRRTGPCPCGSGKKYKNCCGMQSPDVSEKRAGASEQADSVGQA